MNSDIVKNKIRWFRFENNEMSQAQLAEKVGVTRQTIIALEACKYTPSLLLAMKIAKVFHTNVDSVFFFEN